MKKRQPPIVRVYQTPSTNLSAARKQLTEKLLEHTYHTLADTSVVFVSFQDRTTADSFTSTLLSYVGEVI